MIMMMSLFYNIFGWEGSPLPLPPLDETLSVSSESFVYKSTKSFFSTYELFNSLALKCYSYICLLQSDKRAAKLYTLLLQSDKRAAKLYTLPEAAATLWTLTSSQILLVLTANAQ